MCEKLPFFHSPAWSEKALFAQIFFFSEYRFWSQVGASGVVNLSFLRMYGEKKNDKIFQHNDILKEFYNSNYFEFLNFLV